MIRMGRNSKPEESDAPDFQTSSPTTPPAYQYGSESTNTVTRPSTDSENIARDIKDGKLSGFVGHGTTLTGDTTFQMMLRVDGHLNGTVSSEGGTLIVGNNGQLDAHVSVGVANVNGAINGDVTATEKIHLGRTARVVGNISTPKLVIEEGAVFEGGCTMLKARETQEKTAAAANTPSYGTASQYSSSYASTDATDDDDDDEVSLSTAEDEEEKSETATV
ncbi:MAG TPA: polymer-forming cytoskeletal protein [Pyrinomonadaceae bacterium]|nr:polymer-forming cytoskeletal protein [Pyrinomonadaceae bacterium]